jgi:hypothetical protein
MSFRARFTAFFELIVVLPMVAMGVLMFRLIGDSQQGRARGRPRERCGKCLSKRPGPRAG